MTIVEVGPGSAPLYNRSWDARERIEKGAAYIGIDLDPRNVKDIHRGYGLCGTLPTLPLVANCADEIWLLNVFGGLNNRPAMQDGRFVYQLSAYPYFEELNRILKLGGKTYIGEWCPPISHSVNWLHEGDYSNLGFEKEVYIGERFEEFVKRYGIVYGYLWEDVTPFFTVLTKVQTIK